MNIVQLQANIVRADYAEQTERDHEALDKARCTGCIKVASAEVVK